MPAGSSAVAQPMVAAGRQVIYRVCGRPSHDERPPLPAGHPVTWVMLTQGTVIDGNPYPYPVFDLDLY